MEAIWPFEGKYHTQQMKSTEQVKLEYEIFELTKYLDEIKIPNFDSEHKKLSLIERVKILKTTG